MKTDIRKVEERSKATQELSGCTVTIERTGKCEYVVRFEQTLLFNAPPGFHCAVRLTGDDAFKLGQMLYNACNLDMP